jgi:hypothetical protein
MGVMARRSIPAGERPPEWSMDIRVPFTNHLIWPKKLINLSKSMSDDRKEVNPMMYAVFNSHTGLKGIYYDWKEASDAFNGIKGAKAKKFQSLEEAQDWLELQQEVYDERKDRDRMKTMETEQQVWIEADESRELPKNVPKRVPEKYQSGPPAYC